MEEACFLLLCGLSRGQKKVVLLGCGGQADKLTASLAYTPAHTSPPTLLLMSPSSSSRDAELQTRPSDHVSSGVTGESCSVSLVFPLLGGGSPVHSRVHSHSDPLFLLFLRPGSY